MRTVVTVRVSLSTSVSLASTLPLGFTPGTPLSMPPASTASALSSLATGAWLVPRMMMWISAWSFRPPRSVAW
ncbi:hypothetical protein D3C76_1476510 [compost metagenome]